MNRYSLVGALFDLAREEAALRSGFPVGLDVTDPSNSPRTCRRHSQLYRNGSDRWTLTASPHSFARAWQATRPAPIRPLAQTAAMGKLDGDTVLAPRRGLHWQITASREDAVTVHLVDRRSRCRPIASPRCVHCSRVPRSESAICLSSSPPISSLLPGGCCVKHSSYRLRRVGGRGIRRSYPYPVG